MKTLIVYAHPNPKSFNHAMAEAVSDSLRAAGHEVRVRDLYTIGFNPVLSANDFVAFQKKETPTDIAEEQKHVNWATQLVFIYPIWWFNRPAILQGWIDRVFAHGYAFSAGKDGTKGLLKHASALVLQTAGQPESYYIGGMMDAIHRPMVEGTLQFCGIQDVTIQTYYAVPSMSEEKLTQTLDDIRGLTRTWASKKAA